jgi:hypothetical protein
MLKLSLVIGLLILSGLSLLLVNGQGPNALANSLYTDSHSQPKSIREDPSGTIVGAMNPEQVPDRAAYTILFIVLAKRVGKEQEAVANSYLKQFDAQLSASDIDTFMLIADEYWTAVTPLDGKARELKDQHWPRPPAAVMDELRRLQRKKDALIDSKTSSLSNRLSSAGLAILTHRVIPHIKSRIKIAPAPQSLPGGPDWKPRHHIDGGISHD